MNFILRSTFDIIAFYPICLFYCWWKEDLWYLDLWYIKTLLASPSVQSQLSYNNHIHNHNSRETLLSSRLAYSIKHLPTLHTSLIMESVQSKVVQPQPQPTKPLTTLGDYQRHWDKLMEDTNKEIEKIRSKPSPQLSYACRNMTNSDVQRRNRTRPTRPHRDDTSTPGRSWIARCTDGVGLDLT